MANNQDGRNLDPASRRILEELRDLRIEMREDRRRSDEDRKRSDEDRKRSDERFERMMRDSNERFERTTRETKEHFERTRRETSRETKEHFDRVMRDFREDSARREAATQKTWKDLRTEVRTVGFAIVKTLNRNTRLLEHISVHHGRLLERIDRKLGARDNGRPSRGNGRGA